jgi:hypothetical protein
MINVEGAITDTAKPKQHTLAIPLEAVRPIGLNASQPPSRIAPTTTTNKNVSFIWPQSPASETRVPKHTNERPSTLRLVFEVASDQNL